MPKQSKSTTVSESKSTTAATASGGGQDAVSLLTADHRSVEKLFEQYQGTGDQSQKSQLAHKACVELTVHSMLEEEIFYPACREKGVEHDALDEAQVEHDGVKILVSDLLLHPPGSPFYDAKVKVLSDYVKHHVGEEERAGSGIFAKAQAAGVDMTALGERISERKPQLMTQVQSPGFRPPPVRSLDLSSERRYSQEDVMERGYERDRDRDRDEQGRFMSEGGGRYSRRDDDDDRYSGRGGGGGRGGRGQGGWFGDPEGHSRASEEGWEQRRGGGGGGYGSGGGGGYGRSRDDDYDDRYSSRGGGGRGGRGHGGWFGDPEGHSRASEEGWESRRGGGGGGGYGRSRDDDDDDRYSSRGGGGGGRGGRGHGGWFGDPEGHSRASEEGWESRRGGGGGGYGRSRDDDDDDRSSRGGGSRGGRGHGGWFGDPEGHSRASERGWRNR